MRTKKLKIGQIVSIVLLIMVTFFFGPSPVGGTSVVLTDKDIYNQGEAIRVQFANAPGNDSDWLCIVPAGSPDTAAGDYKYIPGGLGQGSLIFDPRSPGEYEVRAYYNYRRNGYVVSGRYAFSVADYPAEEEALAQGAELIEPDYYPEANLPPPIPFVSPPEVIVIPDTNVYVAPDIAADLFFWDGWWWRLWEGRWYRSHYYNRDWGYYNNVPSFYFDVDPGWRGYYRDRNWYGHRWDYERIPHQRLQQNWKRWQNDRRWERRGTWGVQNYQPRPQRQRKELRQQRQQQYQQRPQVRQPRQQIQQPRQQPQVQQQRPQIEQRRPQVEQRRPQVEQRRPQVQQQRPQVEQRRPQVEQRRPQVEQRRPQVQQQRPQVQQSRPQAEQPQQSQPKGKPEGEESGRRR